MAQTTVLGLLVYQLTRSELDLGFLGLAEFAPAALLVVVAGSAVDRFDRRRVAAVGALSNTAVALALAVYLRHPRGAATTPIFLLVLAYGVGQAFLAPALRSVPSAMVSDDRVPWLVARNSVAWQAASITGPLLGGFLYDSGLWVPFVVVAAMDAIGAAAVLAIRIPGETPGHPRLQPPGTTPAIEVGHSLEVGHVLEEGIPLAEDIPAPGSRVREALEGLRFVRAESILLGAISLDLFAVLFGGAVTLLPAIAVRLHVGAIGLGWLRASSGLGAGLMTVLISIRPIKRRVGRALLAAVAVFGAWTVVLGITRSYALSFIAIFALSAADSVSVFVRATLVPLATPPAMRGRVLAVENVFIGASNQLGGFESGAVGQLLGTTGSIVFGGIGTLVVALAWGVLFSPLRRLDGFPSPAERSPQV